jgi:serine O-acetyltransferase
MALIRTLKSDFARNSRLIDRLTILVFRLNQAALRSRARIVARPLARVLDAIWIQGIIGAELPGSIECGPGLRLAHGGRGVIINSHCRIGSGVTIFHRVTLGQSGVDPRDVPVVGDDAYLGTGVIAIGRVSIGRAARVGAGAVVTRDVPPEAVAVGVPARVIETADDRAP